MFVAGVDGCRVGWVDFRVELPARATTVEVIDLCAWLRHRPEDLVAAAIDIPIGLLDGPRSCDLAARKLLGRPRGFSVFPSPCRAAIAAETYKEACATNRLRTGKMISQQTWGIAAKIKEVDEGMTPGLQAWAFEVHPEVCFWAMNGGKSMRYSKKKADGRAERLSLLRPIFPTIDSHLEQRPDDVGRDDVLDAAAAAWSAVRWSEGRIEQVCTPETDQMGLQTTIWY